MKPLILISNDDGYQAKGIRFLIETLRPIARILVVAPDGGRSGMACACTFREPIYLTTISKDDDVTIMSTTGTPVDCIKLAFSHILTERPALVIGGINHGDNSAVNVHYSGTMGVVFEGCFKGIPSVAFSLDSHDADADFTPLAPWLLRITQHVLDKGLPKGSCLNVNFPATPSFKGVRVCSMAMGDWKNEFERRPHPRGGDYYWLTGNFELDQPAVPTSDKVSLNEGYIAVTPIRIDCTDYDLLRSLSNDFCS